MIIPIKFKLGSKGLFSKTPTGKVILPNFEAKPNIFYWVKLVDRGRYYLAHKQNGPEIVVSKVRLNRYSSICYYTTNNQYVYIASTSGAFGCSSVKLPQKSDMTEDERKILLLLCTLKQFKDPEKEGFYKLELSISVSTYGSHTHVEKMELIK